METVSRIKNPNTDFHTQLITGSKENWSHRNTMVFMVNLVLKSQDAPTPLVDI
jgi:hypothetical protein